MCELHAIGNEFLSVALIGL